jgi:hypothetical protein
MPLLSGGDLVADAVFLATLYVVGYTIASTKKMPLHWILTIAGESLVLGSILAFYVDVYLGHDPPWIANIVFLLAVITTIISVVVLFYEAQREARTDTKYENFEEQI